MQEITTALVTIDCRGVRPQVDGLGNHIMSLLEEFKEYSGPLKFCLIVSPASMDRFHGFLNNSHFGIVTSGAKSMGVAQQVLIPLKLLFRRPSLYHYPAHDLPLCIPAPAVVTIHDLNFLYIKDWYTRLPLLKKSYSRAIVSAGVRRAQAVIVVSEHVRKQIEEYYRSVPPENIYVIPNGIRKEFFDRAYSDELERFRKGYSLPEAPLITYIGTIRPHKNLERLVRAFASVKREKKIPHHLLLVGAHHYYTGVQDEIVNSGMEKYVHTMGYVPDESLRLFYQTSDFFVCPSLSEGFGLPVLEAMSCGIPVLCSQAGALPEVGGDSVLYCDPLSVHSMADGLYALSQSPQLKKELAEKGRKRAEQFTWRSAAERVLSVYEKVLGNKKTAVPIKGLRTDRPLKVLFLTSTPVEGACARYRAAQYFPYLASRNVECTLRPFISGRFFHTMYSPGKMARKFLYLLFAIARRFYQLKDVVKADIVFLQREAITIGPPVIEALIFTILRKPVVFDLDDAIFSPYVSPLFGGTLSKLKWFRKAEYILKNSTQVTVGNAYLEKYARRFNTDVTIIPSAIDTRKMNPAVMKESSVPVIGWIGSHSSARYLRELLPVFEFLARMKRFRLKIVGAGEAFALPGVDIMNVEWKLEREIEDFQSLDIGVYPIIEDEWSVGKSGLKVIQYMAVGVPAVCSPVGMVEEIIQDGMNGFLARSHDEWVRKLRLLIEDPALRRRIGQAGRKTVEQHYSLEAWAPKLTKVLHTCMKSER